MAVNLDGGGAPAIPPDGGALCPSGACNYQTGVGCTAGDSCLPTLENGHPAPVCVPSGTVAAGGACQNVEDCVAGHLCVGQVCRKLCCGGDWSACDSASDHCFSAVDFSSNGAVVSTGAMICVPTVACNPLEPSSCTTAGAACQIVDATGATACFAPGTGGSGDPCPCQGGFVCREPKGQSAVCVRLCGAVEGGAAPYCAANEGTCTHYTRDPAGVGECQPP